MKTCLLRSTSLIIITAIRNAKDRHFRHERKESANTIQNYKDTKRNLDPVTSNRKNHGDDKGVCRQVFRPLYLLRLTILINFNLGNQL